MSRRKAGGITRAVDGGRTRLLRRRGAGRRCHGACLAIPWEHLHPRLNTGTLRINGQRNADRQAVSWSAVMTTHRDNEVSLSFSVPRCLGVKRVAIFDCYFVGAPGAGPPRPPRPRPPPPNDG